MQIDFVAELHFDLSNLLQVVIRFKTGLQVRHRRVCFHCPQGRMVPCKVGYTDGFTVVFRFDHMTDMAVKLLRKYIH
ncbi:hypothetical protein D3C85_1739030 [compost metagenome]